MFVSLNNSGACGPATGIGSTYPTERGPSVASVSFERQPRWAPLDGLSRKPTTAASTAWKPCSTRSTASVSPTRSTWRRMRPPKRAATAWCWPKSSPAPVARPAPAPPEWYLPPCAGADVAFDAAMERYARKDLAVVMYHVHVPRPDPMTTEGGTARSKNYGVTGVPTFAIDGKKTMGGGSRDMAPGVFERFQKDLEKDLETAPEAQVKIDAGLNGLQKT